MFRTVVTRRTFTSAARLAKEEKTFTEQAADMAKKVAGAFKSDGAIGKECTPAPSPPNCPPAPVSSFACANKSNANIDVPVNADGKVGGTAQEVGGPFSADGAIGKQFTKDGAVGGTGEAVAKKGQEKAQEKKY